MAEEYNLAAIRQLLLAAFTPQELRRFCQDRAAFQPLVYQFAPGDGLADMVDEVVDYCETRLLWEEFLAGVAQANPRQYARFASSLQASGRASSQGVGPRLPQPVPERTPPAETVAGPHGVAPSEGAASPAAARLFLSYARQDRDRVLPVYRALVDAGLTPWMDVEDILPGERWETSIQRAIRASDFCLVFLSANSVAKRGFVQKEIRQALEIWQEMLDSDIYLIPVRLEPCEAPESLVSFQWVNLYEEGGWPRLLAAIQAGMDRRGSGGP